VSPTIPFPPQFKMSTSTILFPSLPAHGVIVSARPVRDNVRLNEPARKQYSWFVETKLASEKQWKGVSIFPVVSNVTNPHELIRDEVMWRPYVCGQNQAIAVQERKGLKALIDEAKRANDGVEEFFARYTRAYSAGSSLRRRLVLRETDIPAVDVRMTEVQYRIVVPKVRWWMGIQTRATSISQWGGITTVTTVFVSPRRFADDAPLAMRSDLDERVTDSHPVFRHAYTHNNTGTIHFLNKEGEIINSIAVGRDPTVGDANTLMKWFQEHCHDKVWEEHTQTVKHTHGTREEITYTGGYNGGWSPTGVDVIMKGRRDELKEQLVAKVFHPARLEKMMEAYGENWAERV
jgi:hypothetical protein